MKWSSSPRFCVNLRSRRNLSKSGCPTWLKLGLNICTKLRRNRSKTGNSETSYVTVAEQYQVVRCPASCLAAFPFMPPLPIAIAALRVINSYILLCAVALWE